MYMFVNKEIKCNFILMFYMNSNLINWLASLNESSERGLGFYSWNADIDIFGLQLLLSTSSHVLKTILNNSASKCQVGLLIWKPLKSNTEQTKKRTPRKNSKRQSP